MTEEKRAQRPTQYVVLRRDKTDVLTIVGGHETTKARAAILALAEEEGIYVAIPASRWTEMEVSYEKPVTPKLVAEEIMLDLVVYAHRVEDDEALAATRDRDPLCEALREGAEEEIDRLTTDALAPGRADTVGL